MPLFIYFSLPDLHYPHFKPGESESWARYIAFHQGQVRELCTGYGKVAGFWFDPGPHHGPDHLYQLAETEKMIHQLQPDAIVMGRDFYESEQRSPELPGNISGLDDQGEVVSNAVPMPRSDNWPFEVCDTMNRSWFYEPADINYRSAEELLRELIEIVGKGGNLLLDISPKPSGSVPPEQLERLKFMGQWLRKNGQYIYGTRPVAMPKQSWGYIVKKDKQVYLHILNWPGEKLTVEGLPFTIESVQLPGNEAVDFSVSEEKVEILLPEDAREPIDTIIIMDLKST